MDMTAFRNGVSIDRNRWQDFGGKRFRRWRVPRTKMKTTNKNKRRAREEAETSCTCCGRHPDDSAGGSEDGQSHASNRPVPPRRVGARSVRVGATGPLTRGYVDSRPCVACLSEWEGGSRPLHPAKLARELLMTKPVGGCAALRSTLQFADLLQQDVFGLGPTAEVTSTGVCSSFELMVRARGRSPTPSFTLSFVFSDALSLPQGAYLDLPRLREIFM